MNPIHVAVVGATGAVGSEVLRILEERRFPLASLRPTATARSAGKTLRFAGEDLAVVETSEQAFDGIDVAIFDTPDEAALAWVPVAQKAGVVCVDNSAAFRLRDDVPLVVPEVNPEAAATHEGIIANPNCTMVTLLMPLAPLHRAAHARRVIASSYQSVSGAGVAGVEDLYEQLEKLTPERDAVRDGAVDGLVPAGRAFAHPIAFNVIPHVGGFDADGATSEERRVRDETRKILAAPDIDIFATTVRVPAIRAHGVAAWVEFESEIDPATARQILSAAPGVELADDPASALYPTSLMASGKDKAYVGRIRSGGAPNTLGFFTTCDNLRKGAALNTVQIAELLLERGLL
ncbi:MAG TPA: aspartate-semialdehyde dehydrogenase [Actinomycetota bacterium]|nr:aspartate-semialdehyde dehydrogenase [Actinomycetota bacterium]